MPGLGWGRRLGPALIAAASGCGSSPAVVDPPRADAPGCPAVPGSIRVVDARDGSPVRADLWLGDENGIQGDLPPRLGQTREDGTLAWDALDPDHAAGSGWLWASATWPRPLAGGPVPFDLRAVRDAGVVLAVGEGGVITGRIVDRATGRGIPGANLRAYDHRNYPTDVDGDRAGRFRMAGLLPGERYALTPVARGYVPALRSIPVARRRTTWPQRRGVLDDPDGVVVQAARGGPVDVTVPMDWDRGPVLLLDCGEGADAARLGYVGVQVRAEGVQLEPLGLGPPGPGGPLRVDLAEHRGRTLDLELTAEGAPPVHLSIACPDDPAAVLHQRVAFALGPPRPSPRVAAPRTVTGTVREATTGRPLPCAVVVVRSNDGGRVEQVLVRTRSDAEGRYAFDRVAIGHQAYVAVEDAPWCRDADVRFVAGRLDDHYPAVSRMCRAADGSPTPPIDVRAHDLRGRDAVWRLEMPPGTPMPRTIAVCHWHEVTTPAAPEQPGGASGRSWAWTQDGRHESRLARADGHERRRWCERRVVPVDAGGTVRWYLPRGRNRAVLRAGGLASPVFDDAVEGPAAPLVRVAALAPEAAVTVQVVDADGAALRRAGVRVHLQWIDPGASPQWDLGSRRTDAEGRVRVEALLPPLCGAAFEPEGLGIALDPTGESPWPWTLTAEAVSPAGALGAGAFTMAVALREWEPVAVRIVDREGEPIAGLAVAVWPPGHAGPRARAVSGADGVAALDTRPDPEGCLTIGVHVDDPAWCGGGVLRSGLHVGWETPGAALEAAVRERLPVRAVGVETPADFLALPARELLVQARTADGAPLRGARVSGWTSAIGEYGVSVDLRGLTDDGGVARVRVPREATASGSLTLDDPPDDAFAGVGEFDGTTERVELLQWPAMLVALDLHWTADLAPCLAGPAGGGVLFATLRDPATGALVGKAATTVASRGPSRMWCPRRPLALTLADQYGWWRAETTWDGDARAIIRATLRPADSLASTALEFVEPDGTPAAGVEVGVQLEWSGSTRGALDLQGRTDSAGRITLRWPHGTGGPWRLWRACCGSRAAATSRERLEPGATVRLTLAPAGK